MIYDVLCMMCDVAIRTEIRHQTSYIRHYLVSCSTSLQYIPDNESEEQRYTHSESAVLQLLPFPPSELLFHLHRHRVRDAVTDDDVLHLH